MVGVQRNTALVELYVGNNRLENPREVFVLKNLPSLVILDLFGNPVVNAADNYRLFVIYHLKALKALDGNAIVSFSYMFTETITPEWVLFPRLVFSLT